jgi:hypothetical protein
MKKAIRNTLIGVLVLLVLAVGGGVAYTWYNGQNSTVDTAAIATPVEPKPAPVIKPIKPAADANVSASVQSLTSPVKPGSNASVNVKTLAGAKCDIIVEYNKIKSKDSGLITKNADDFGIVAWAWTVESSVPYGKWPVKITCSRNDKSAVVQADLIVVDKLEEE